MTEQERDRPDPDAILARIHREERQKAAKKRGHLRIYLGAFAGVGKTYAMLNEAHRRLGYGEDVVVGYAETHGRPGTVAQLEGLEVLPRRRIEYRGVVVEEMDVDAVIARRPQVCLVDELAHTNAPGSKHEKRYEDVAEIRDAGIDVVSTLNVQHLESLNDTVAAITGIRVRETLPDSVLDDADEVILVDLSPEGARARMEHGNVYPPEQARRALDSFFRPENLAALRELALRRTTHEVDERLDEYMREAEHEPAPTDRVLALVDYTAASRSLLRYAWRLADGLAAELLVVYFLHALSEQQQHDLERVIELAEDFNAVVQFIEAPAAKEADELVRHMKAENVQHLVMQRPPRRLVAGHVRATLFDRVVASAPYLSIHLAPEMTPRTP